MERKLPKICRNGAIFFDLINRLEGKEDTIRGLYRNPKNQTQINANY